MGDHPFRDGQSHPTRWPPRHAAFGNPGERPIFAVAKRGSVQRRVAGHHVHDTRDVVGVDCLLELPELLEGLDMSLELGPTRKSIETCDLKLGIGERCGRAGLEQILGLVFEVAQIRTVGKRAWCLVRISRHSDLLSSKRPVSAQSGRKKVAEIETERWASTLSADRMRPLTRKDPIMRLGERPSGPRAFHDAAGIRGHSDHWTSGR